jgi:hypothetical protein
MRPIYLKHVLRKPEGGGEGAGGAGGGGGSAGGEGGAGGDAGGGGSGEGGGAGAGGLMADALKGQQSGGGDGNNGNGAGAGAGGGTGGAGGQGGEGGGSGAAGGDAGAGNNSGGSGNSGAKTRPDFLPEQFWDAEKGEARVESLAKSWADTRAALKNKGGEAPKTPEEYQFRAPEGVTVDKDDPGLKFFRAAAHKAGISNEAFNIAAGEFLKQAHESGLLEPIKPVDAAAEMKKLGEAGDAMVRAVTAWGLQMKENGIWTDEDFAEVVILGSTADGIRALNKLREYYGGDRIPVNTGQQGAALDVQTYYAKMGETDKNGELKVISDPQFRAEMEAEAKRIFGTNPAHSSIPGAGLQR